MSSYAPVNITLKYRKQTIYKKHPNIKVISWNFGRPTRYKVKEGVNIIYKISLVEVY